MFEVFFYNKPTIVYTCREGGELVIKILLKDRTTGKNILWANAERATEEIFSDEVYLIEPRWKKLRAQQKQRTRDRAEIFTPPHVCKIQNDLLAAEKKSWTDYVDEKFLEITCGEAPYIVSRYNAVTGAPIEIKNRVGLLDRKLRVVSKETSALNDWINFSLRAVQSVYGYEFQGDNLFLARKNIFETVKDFFAEKFSSKPPENFLRKVAEIISWNFWQMDGLTCSPPFTEEANLFGGANCLIKDWRTGKIFEFRELLKGGRR